MKEYDNFGRKVQQVKEGKAYEIDVVGGKMVYLTEALERQRRSMRNGSAKRHPDFRRKP